MEIIHKRLPVKLLELNKGQIDGLPANPRLWDRPELERLKKSLTETPELYEARGILCVPHGKKYVVLGGNMRLEASKELKFEDVPCCIFPEDMPIAKMKEIVIKDNGSFGQNDYEALANEWDDLPLTEWGIPAWSPEEAQGKEDEPEANEDDFDEEKDYIEVRCKRGDIWQLGRHRLMCGDSTDAEQVAKLMNGEKADLCITDPPYGVSYTEKNEFLNRRGTGHRLTTPIENDDKAPQEMYPFWVAAFKNLCEFSKERMAYYITAPQGGDLLLLLQAVRDSGFMLKHQLIWNKNNHVLGRCDYDYKHEPIIYGWKIGGTHHFVGGGKFKTSVWDVPKPLQSKLHPTMKPVELFSEMMLDNSNEQAIVLDLFGGSGTTLIAAEQLERTAYLMELDPHYCDVIIARWEKLTGQTAQKI